MALDSKEKKELAKRRKEAAKQAQQYHKNKNKQKKESAKKEKSQKGKTKKEKTKKEKTKPKKSVSKIEEAVNSGKASNYENISREEKFMRESEERIRNLKPQDFEDGYYIDEYAEKQRQKKRLKIIRKQEREVIKRNKKPMTSKQVRKRRIIITASIFLAVIVIGVILSLTVLFKTEKIDIEGDEYYYDNQIIGFSNVSLQQNIFIAALNSTPDKISEKLPYVEKAEIGVAIPDTVTIKITNAVPSYAVKDGSEFLIISSKGRILERTAQNAKGLTELVCSEVENKEPGSYLTFSDSNVSDILETVASSLSENGVDKVTALDIKNLNEITFNYDNHITVKLGLPEDLNYKIRTAMKIINEKLDPNKTGAIYGTLDVSTCAKNKMSHYKPADTEPPTTVPATTNPSEATQETTLDQNGNAYNNGTGDDYSAGGNAYDNGTGGDYSAGGSAYDNGGTGYDYSAGGSAYDNGGTGYDYSAGGNAYDNGGTGYDYNAGADYNWNSGYDAYSGGQW